MFKQIFATSLITLASTSAFADVTVTKNLNICVKAYSDQELSQAIRKCTEMASSLQAIEQSDVKFSNLACSANARGIGQGFVTGQCGVYDVVLSGTLTVSN